MQLAVLAYCACFRCLLAVLVRRYALFFVFALLAVLLAVFVALAVFVVLACMLACLRFWVFCCTRCDCYACYAC